MKIWTTLTLLIIVLLSACASPKSVSPTPTIVRLEGNALKGTATTVVADPTATATLTPISPPLPTVTVKSIFTATTPPTSPTATTPTPSPTAQAEVITTALYLRAGPSPDYKIIGGANKGEQFEVTGISPSGAWLQIVIPESGLGWISAKPDYTRLISAQFDDLPLIETTVTVETEAEAAESSSTSGSAEQPVARSDNNTPGSKLIFATHSGGDLYIINIDGTGLQKLAGGIIDPVVSPAGQQVAFTRWNSGEMGTLYVMNIDGSNERAILGEVLQAKSPTWSQDGQEIILSFQHGGLRDPDEVCRRYKLGERIRIPNNSTVTGSTWIGEKNIQQVCFIPFEDLQWGLRRVNLGSRQFEDLPADLYSFSPTWDPIQDWRVLYNTDKGLMQLDVTTGDLTPLTDDVRDKAPIFSPDGQWLALSYKQHDHWEVYTYNLSSGARHRLTKPHLLADPQYSSAAPAWSPDSSQIAFVTNRSGSWEIWVMNADGSEQRPLFSPEVQAQLGLDYQGVNERLLNWVGSASSPAAGFVRPSTASGQSSEVSNTGTAAATNISLSGMWDFTFGSLALSQQGSRVEGIYHWYGGTDSGKIEGIVVADLNQFQGIWISERNPTSQKLLRWQLAPDGHSFSGTAVGGSTEQQWCGVRSGQPLPAGCGFSGVWNLRFGNLPLGTPPGTGQATLVQSGQTVQGTYMDSTGQTGGLVEGLITVHSTTEAKLIGTWRNNQGQQDTFEWRLDLTTGRTFQGRRHPGNSEWCGWRQGTDEAAFCGWED